jgi:hypothetical protein
MLGFKGDRPHRVLNHPVRDGLFSGGGLSAFTFNPLGW